MGVSPCAPCYQLNSFAVKTPSSLFGSTLQGIQPKFYALGLMYALNARITFQQQFVSDNTGVSSRLHTSSGFDANSCQGQVFAMSNRPTQKTQLQVDVETETYVQTSSNVLTDEKPRLNRVSTIASPVDPADDVRLCTPPWTPPWTTRQTTLTPQTVAGMDRITVPKHA